MLEIRTKEDFKKLAYLVNNDIDTKVDAKLGNDILFDENDMIPSIGNDDDISIYQGTFDGCGHTIEFRSHKTEGGLFYLVGCGGKIKNTIFKGELQNACIIGNVIGASIENCTSYVKHIIDRYVGGRSVGGLVNQASQSSIINCTNKGSFEFNLNGSMTRLTLSVYALGGICGQAKKTEITGCENFADITLQGSSESEGPREEKIRLSEIGGICGAVNHAVIKNCNNYGNFNISHLNANIISLGGLVGVSKNMNYEPTGRFIIEDSTNYGNIELPKIFLTNKQKIGGVIGRVEGRYGSSSDLVEVADAEMGVRRSFSRGQILSNTFWVEPTGTNLDDVSYAGHNDAAYFAFRTGDFDISKKFIDRIKDPTIINEDGENLLLSLCSRVDGFIRHPDQFIQLVQSLAEKGVDFTYQNPLKETMNKPTDFLLDQSPTTKTKRVLRGFKDTVKFIEEVAKEQKREQEEKLDDFSSIGW